MKKQKNIKWVWLAFSFLLAGCEGTFNPSEILGLEAIRLQSPQQSTVCEVYGEAPGEKWVVPFSWTITGDYNGNFRVVATERNGGGGSVEGQTFNRSLELELERGKFYEWRVEAIEAPNVNSGTNEFVTPANIGVATSPPILSDITVTQDSVDKYRLTYTAIDGDGDNITFDVYVDTNANPTNLRFNDTTDSEVTVTLLPGTTYYIRVEASDGTNITSSSRSYTTPQ